MMKPFPFPFEIIALAAPVVGADGVARWFCVQPAAGGRAALYRDLFQAFGFSGNGLSWSEHLQAIVEEETPELFDHLEFVADAASCRMYADSQASVDRLTALICPLFADLHRLRRHFSLLDSEDFFE
jgi:hypothetical protein